MLLILGYITVAGTALAAIVIIWKKGIKPVAKFITSLDTIIPLMVDLSETFKNTPYAFQILDEIVAQFRTDSGSSLRDVVNRLEQVAGENKALAKDAAKVADLVRISIEATKQLDQQDREELRSMLLRLDRLAVAVDAGAATGLRNEAAAGIVASDLATKEGLV